MATLRRRVKSSAGYTFVELLVVSAILATLAAVALPLVQVTAQRQREVELRRALREMRDAIDRFKDAVDSGAIPQTELKPANEGYPPDMDTLVEGVEVANDATGRKLRFGLRRIPIDPMTNSTDWNALLSGQAGLGDLGTAERLRRLQQERGDGPEWNALQGLVSGAGAPGRVL